MNLICHEHYEALSKISEEEKDLILEKVANSIRLALRTIGSFLVTYEIASISALQVDHMDI